MTAKTVQPAALHTMIERPAPDAFDPLIGASNEICRLLRRLQDVGAPLRILGAGQQQVLVTRVLEIDTVGGRVLVTGDRFDREVDARVPRTPANITAGTGNAAIAMTIDDIRRIEIDGIPCYSLGIPSQVLSLELRDAMRVLPAPDDGVILVLPVQGEDSVRCSVHDLSEAGVGARIGVGKLPLARNARIDDVCIELPHVRLTGLSISIRYLAPGAGGRFGAEIIRIPAGADRALRRYVQSRGSRPKAEES